MHLNLDSYPVILYVNHYIMIILPKRMYFNNCYIILFFLGMEYFTVNVEYKVCFDSKISLLYKYHKFSGGKNSFLETQSKIARNHKHLWVNSEFLWSP